MRVGIVLFGDGWNHGTDLPAPGNIGANLSCIDHCCCPASADGSAVGVKGCSNGCWFANPQDRQRGPDGDDLQHANATFIKAKFQPYVESVVRPLLDDSRVAFWEVYNEPCEWRHYFADICTYFQVETSTIIKQSSYKWVRALIKQQREAQPQMNGNRYTIHSLTAHSLHTHCTLTAHSLHTLTLIGMGTGHSCHSPLYHAGTSVTTQAVTRWMCTCTIQTSARGTIACSPSVSRRSRSRSRSSAAGMRTRTGSVTVVRW
jgi:hypothetical protein